MFLFYPAGILPGALELLGVCITQRTLILSSDSQKLLRAINNCYTWTEGNVPYEKVTVLQRSWNPQKHWESKGVRDRKGVIFYITRSYLHLLTSRSVCRRTKNGGS